MTKNTLRRCAYVALVTWAAAAVAASTEVFKARLAPLGVTQATVNTITGVGYVTATLEGSRLIVDASFDGLTGMATSANIRRGPKGIPGPIVFDLQAPKASSGKISASLELDAAQLSDLRAGRLYLQIHSERAPDGSIRGWLLANP
jgi:hypothetical protein